MNEFSSDFYAEIATEVSKAANETSKPRNETEGKVDSTLLRNCGDTTEEPQHQGTAVRSKTSRHHRHHHRHRHKYRNDDQTSDDLTQERAIKVFDSDEKPSRHRHRRHRHHHKDRDLAGTTTKRKAHHHRHHHKELVGDHVNALDRVKAGAVAKKKTRRHRRHEKDQVSNTSSVDTMEKKKAHHHRHRHNHEGSNHRRHRHEDHCINADDMMKETQEKFKHVYDRLDQEEAIQEESDRLTLDFVLDGESSVYYYFGSDDELVMLK